jgi:4-hydroxy-2-oxovalerate/4-hydroxy-2-oxohexanoate aldolase
MAAVLDRMGAVTGIDIFKLMDAAEDHVMPIMDEPVRLSRDSLVLGYAGAYSSFLLFAKRAQAKYGVPSHEILLEMANRKTVGGQEDLIEDIAMQMARARG